MHLNFDQVSLQQPNVDENIYIWLFFSSYIDYIALQILVMSQGMHFVLFPIVQMYN